MSFKDASQAQWYTVKKQQHFFQQVLLVSGRTDVTSRHIVLMRTNVIRLLNRVPEHDLTTFFVLHRTNCKPMHFEQG